MTSIANLFSNFDDLTKTKSITDSATEYKKHKFNKSLPTPALSQGDKFKRYQNKIKQKISSNRSDINTIEGFGTSSSNSSSGFKNGLTSQSTNLLSQTDMTSQQSTISNLKKEYNSTLAKYKLLLDINSKKNSEYIKTVSQSNPYLNQVIVFTTGHCCAVTNQGVVKYIPSWDYYTNATGITNPKLIYLNIPLPADFWTPGSIVPTNPPLISGTTLTSNQSLGNEGNNIFVDSLVSNDITSTYQGCYADNSTTPAMTFIGGSPPANAGIQNGNFDQPTYANDTYIYIDDSSTVPNWTFNNGVIMNNSSAWGYPTPYPNGNQAASLQAVANNCAGGSISQTLSLNIGTYTLSFWACGRNCCDGSGLAGVINVQLNGTTVTTITPAVNVWASYSVTLNVSTSGSNTIAFEIDGQSYDRSSAIQGVVIASSGSSSSSSQGTYSYDMCKQAAITGGYQYFALQNVNPSTAQGYCAVSNNYVSATQNGISQVPSKNVSLWSSNTGSNVGVSATLTNQGALSVLNSSGASVYNTPNTTAQPNNYLGCYSDSSKRAMTLYNKGSQSYDLSGCQQIAQQNNYSYFGLQNSTSGTNAQCTLSNSLTQAGEYGPAGNCTQVSDGSWSGGGWSNAVYQTTEPSSIYYLILQDDGNMCVYRGNGPNDNQGLIWAAGTNGQLQSANPVFAAANGKYGQNYIVSGSTLAAGDFVGSTTGNMALVMQSDGNLVLYTYTMVTNCNQMTDGNMGAGILGNAVYKLSEVGIPSNLGQFGYVDANSELFSYPSGNLQKSTNYFKIPNTSNANMNNSNIIYNGYASLDTCNSYCNENGDCAGYMYDNTNGVCQLQTPGNLPPNAQLTSLQGTDTYINIPEPINVPTGASNKVSSINSVTYQNYINGGSIGNQYGLAKITSEQEQQVSQLESQLNSLSSQISQMAQQFSSNDAQVSQQLKTNVDGSNTYLSELKETNTKIKNYNTNMDSLLDDSDIVVLQKNYDYMFWTILATGAVLVSMNIVKSK